MTDPHLELSEQLNTPLPTQIADVAQLEDLLSTPSENAVEALRQVQGDILILGVGGKMGPTLARLARRAADLADGGRAARRIIGAARFSNPELKDELARVGVETIQCDLLEQASIDALPDVPNIIYMAARKFGSTGNEPLTWAMNCVLPTMVCKRFPNSRIVAFSTGNVNSFTTPASGGSRETDPLVPVGEYGMSAMGRERIFSYFSEANNQPIAIVRLNYAHEMRYGVMVDLAQQVHAGTEVPVAMGYFNAIWQGDANAMTVAALAKADSPARVFNMAGPNVLVVREVATELGKRMGKEVSFSGVEAPTALLSNGEFGIAQLGSPRVDEVQLIDWIADWVARGGELHGKPTHFEVRDGKF